MSDIATLGIAVDTRGVQTGSDALDTLAAKGAKAEAATTSLGKATDLLSRLYRDLALAAAAWKVLDMIRDAALLNARYETLGVAMNVIGRNAGYTADQMELAAQGMQKMGISMVESRQQAMRLVQAHISLADSQKLARIAQDAAVIGNVNSSNAFATMIHGIQTGQTDVLRTIGLNVSMEQSYTDYAKTLGVTAGALTQNQKTQAVLNSVMREGAAIAGTYEAAMDTAGKQLKSMERYTEDLKVKQGEVFNEILTVGVMAYTAHLKAANGELDTMASNGELKAWGIELTTVFVGIANAIDNIMTAAKMAGNWLAQRNVAGDITAKFQTQIDAIPNDADFGNAAKRAELVRRRDAEIQNSLKVLDESQVELAGRTDRFEKAWDARQAANAQKATAATAKIAETEKFRTGVMAFWAAERQAGRLKEQDYVKAMNSFLIANYGDNHVFADSGGGDDKGAASAANAAASARIEALRRGLAVEAELTRGAIDKITSDYRRGSLDQIAYIHAVADAEEMQLARAVVAAEDEYAIASTKTKNVVELARLRGDIDKAQAALEARASKQTLDIGDEINRQQLDHAQGRRRAFLEAYDAQLANTNASIAYRLALEDENRLVQFELDLMHVAEPLRERFIAQRRIEIDLEKKLREIKQQGGTDSGAREAEARAAAAIAMGTAMSALDLKALKEVEDMLDPARAESFGDALKDAFGGAGSALRGLTSAFQDYVRKQSELLKVKQRLDALPDGAEKIKGEIDLSKRQQEAQVHAYAEMAGAAKGFFKEGSAGYRAMYGVEKGLRLAELAERAIGFAQKMGWLTAETAAVVGGNQMQAASSAVAAETEVIAKMAIAQANAIAGISNQANGDPYSAFPRMAAMAAIMAGLGLVVGMSSGGGGGSAVPISETRQKQQGTGTILGDASAKSDSIANSISALEETAKLELGYQSGMLAALRNIENSLGGLASLVVRTTGLTGKYTGNTPMGRIGGNDPFGTSGLLSKLWGGVSNKLADQGIEFDLQRLVSIIDEIGVVAHSFSDIEQTKSSWFGLSKSTSMITEWGDLDKEILDQFTGVIVGLTDTTRLATGALGLSAEDFASNISGVMVSLGKVSFKGMTGKEIEEAMGNVFSALGDDIARAAMPTLVAFQKVGEGMFETIIRVSSGVETAAAILEQLGVASVAYTDVLYKQGDVAAEIVRQSLLAVEGLGGVAEMMATLDGTASELADTYGQLKDIQKALVAVGEDPAALNRGMVRGAGGLDPLAGGLASYFDNMFSAEEKVSAKAGALRLEFERIGLAMPATNTAFHELASGLLDGTEAGSKLFGQVMLLVDPFVELTNATTELDDAATKLAEDLAKAQDAVRNINGEINSLRGEAMRNLASAEAAVQQNLSTIAAANKTAQEGLTSARTAFYTSLQGVVSAIAQAGAAVTTAQTAVVQARAGITAGYLNALDVEAAAKQRLTDAELARAEAMRQAGDGILAMLHELAGSGSVRKAAAVTMADFEALAKRAMGGDVTAAAGVAAAGKAAVEASRSSSRTREQFNLDQIKVQERLAQVLGVTGSGAGRSGQGDPMAAAGAALSAATADVAKWLAAVKESGASKTAEQVDLLAAYHKGLEDLAAATDSQARLMEASAGLDLEGVQVSTDAWSGAVTTALKAQEALTLAEDKAQTTAADLAAALVLAADAGLTVAAVKTPIDLLTEALAKVTEAQDVVTAVHGELYVAEDALVSKYWEQIGALVTATAAVAKFQAQIDAQAPAADAIGADGLPHFASGGAHAGGWAIVGEQGPEAVYMPPSHVYTAGQTRGMFAGEGEADGGEAFVSEFRAFRRESRTIGVELIKRAQNQDKRWKKFDGAGMPPIRT